MDQIQSGQRIFNTAYLGTSKKHRMKNKLIKIALITISTFSFVNILAEWNQSEHLNNVITGSYFTLLLVAALSAGVLILFTFSCTRACTNVSIISEKAIPYQLYMTIVYARSCHVWTHTIHKQLIVSTCGEIITLGAPTNINWTCIDNCDGGVPQEHHNLPFISSDATFNNASKECNPWFKDDKESLLWTTSWETIIFTCLLVHCTLNILKKSLNFLDCVDFASLLATSSIAFVPKAYYSIYNIGGVIRFLGLGHVIVALEYKIKTKQLVGLILVLKLMFVALMGTALMFVAEKPCHALQSDCDEGFEHFGDTLYFVFVTLSTVGFGDMAPRTDMGKTMIVFIIMASISYLPNIISDVLEMCKDNPIQDRLREIHKDIKHVKQVGFFMHGGTRRNKQKKRQSTSSRILNRLKNRNKTRHKAYKEDCQQDLELTSLINPL